MLHSIFTPCTTLGVVLNTDPGGQSSIPYKDLMVTNNSNSDASINEHEVARVTLMSVATVRRWRLTGKGGPPYLKIGAAVRYRREDVQAWLDKCQVGGTQAEAA